MAKIIGSRTVLGEYQPHRQNEADERVPEGKPIKNYYPAVVDEDLWVKANAAINIRRKGSAGRPQAEVANLIPGLARCACGARMMLVNKGNARIMCSLDRAETRVALGPGLNLLLP